MPNGRSPNIIASSRFIRETLPISRSGWSMRPPVLSSSGCCRASFLQKSVRVADRAATEAKDAIVAAQAGADAAATHARSAEEANEINRGLLIATQRPWISAELAP